jgi:hypothetical protein
MRLHKPHTQQVPHGHLHEADDVLSREEQEQIATKVDLMMRRDRIRLARLANGEMSAKAYRDLLAEDHEELRELLKEVG